MAKKQSIKYNIVNCVPYQQCPNCNGEGFKTIYNPSVTNFMSQKQCNTCLGKGIIPMYILPIEIKQYPFKPNECYIKNNKGEFIQST